jgi:calcineurin-like phosphoesterase family protein
MATLTSVASSGYSTHLRRYPYLTDTVISYATINWATDRSGSSGFARWGKVGLESCTAHSMPASQTLINVNGVTEYQWKVLLNLVPGTQYCYRVYLRDSIATEIDLLGSDPSPIFWTQVPAGSTQSYSFAVFGDWGYVDEGGINPYQAKLMSLIAASGARFAVTTGDNGYPSGTQTNYGDLIQNGEDISAIFGPSFWKVPGASLPIFPTIGNHGLTNYNAHHPHLLNWPQDRAVLTSGGRYTSEVYCCLNGTFPGYYPSAWYAFDAGLARFYILDAAWGDTNVGTVTPYQNDYEYHWVASAAEYQWLQADLATHPSLLKFAFFHFPLISDGQGENSDTFLQGKDSLEGLLNRYGVDIAFTGHAHIYERNFPSPTGLYNYVTGGGGGQLNSLGDCSALDAYAIRFTNKGKACGSAPVPTRAEQVYHFLLVTVNGSKVTVAPVNALGQTFDVITYDFSTGKETNPPTQPLNLKALPVNGAQINLIWTAAADDRGIRGYGIYRNDQLVATVDATTLHYSDTDVALATKYVYTVDAFDGSGNHSKPSKPAFVTTSKGSILISPVVYVPITNIYMNQSFD